MRTAVQQRTEDYEQLINRHRHQSFRGVARVRFDNLTFPNPLPLSQHEPPPLDPHNVSRLAKIFEKGCYNSLPENRILVILNESQFAAALRLLDISPEAFRADGEDTYELVSPLTQPFACYDGRHRIEAAKRCLHGGDRWWSADILVTDG
jgi:hypothetical protein